MIRSPFATVTASNASLASHIRRLQSDVGRANAEVASGRHEDVGIAVGHRTGALTLFRQEITALERTTDTNNVLASRLEAAQAGLNSIVTSGQSYLGALMSARGNSQTAGIVANQAAEGLRGLVDAANTNFAGHYVFSGLAWDTPPMQDYFGNPPPASKSAVDAAFFAEFGVSNTDPAVSNIPVSSMQAFMDNTFDSLFTDAAWSANWTSATVEVVDSLVSRDRVVESSVSLREEAFREITSAFVLVGSVGTENLNDAAYEAVIDEAIRRIGGGLAKMGELQGTLGTAQEQVRVATTSIETRMIVVNEYVGKEEQVDLSEVSLRLNAAMNQLEATYAITSRLQNLSLLDVL